MTEAEFDSYIAEYTSRVFAFTLRLSGNREIAEDATQEAFIKAWKNRKKFDPAKSFQPWIFAIARNAALDLLRKRGDLPFSRFEDRPDGRAEAGEGSAFENLAAEDDLPDAVSERGLTRELIERTMEELSLDQRAAVYLHDVEGLTFDEISAMTGRPLNTEKSHYRRAILALRKKLSGKLEQ